MNARIWKVGICGFLAAGLLVSVNALAQDKKPDAPKTDAPKPADKKPAGDEAKMMEMMEKLGTPGEQHKFLEKHFGGDWTYTVKHWMDPAAPPAESTGTAAVKTVMGGRYLLGDYKGTFEMPGPDGKMQSHTFEGHAIMAYDNATQKFVSSWIDSMSTGVYTSTGTYDPATKTLTMQGEMDMGGGMKYKVREVHKITDENTRVMEWHDNMTGSEKKSMEITYKRKGAK